MGLLQSRHVAGLHTSGHAGCLACHHACSHAGHPHVLGGPVVRGAGLGQRHEEVLLAQGFLHALEVGLLVEVARHELGKQGLQDVHNEPEEDADQHLQTGGHGMLMEALHGQLHDG